MNSNFGLFLYQKEKKDLQVLKDLMQLLRTNSPSRSVSFSYVEARTSLIPHLTLWENLQLEVGVSSLQEFQRDLHPQFKNLLSLLRDPHMLTSAATLGETLVVSLLKGIVSPSQNILVDVNEDLLSPVLMQMLKSCFIELTKIKTVYLASAQPSIWLDCAFGLVTRKDYRFEVVELGAENLKRHWAA
ncbi:MAG TPA: hypothetical protein VNJ01_05475 [Bacteriovoracaceae bacterium]|nr:hypothetical protein [Bacteriovoracaceae bacterium]